MKKNFLKFDKKYFKQTIKRKSLDKNLINNILYAKSIAYHALFVTLRTNVTYSENYLFNSTYLNAGKMFRHKNNVIFKKAASNQSKEIENNNQTCYIYLADALNDIDASLTLVETSQEKSNQYIWYKLLVSMYKITLVISEFSLNSKTSNLQKEILILLAKETFSWKVVQEKISEHKLEQYFNALAGLNKKLITVLLPAFSGCRRFTSKENVLTTLRAYFPCINFVDFIVRNSSFNPPSFASSEEGYTVNPLDELEKDFITTYWKNHK